jgi:L-amino acid N-acyltransferase YncA
MQMPERTINTNTCIRLAKKEDAGQVLAIYSPFCLDSSPVSFETSPPSLEEMENRIEKTLEQLPWVVWDEDGEVLGYAYASQHRPRSAYQWCVDVSVYMSATRRNMGAGAKLYAALFTILRLQGYINAYAGITIPNPASVRLHENVGFSLVATYRQVGYKGGAWHDVSWYELSLKDKQLNPPVPKRLPEVASGLITP